MASNQILEGRLKAALADRYRIESEIGSGGMATVFLAEDLKHHRKVAVKVLTPALSAVVGTDRFLAEIETTANLQHPNILPLFDSGSADGLVFYVMPYVEGESLRQRLDREKQLPVGEAVRIATDVAEALQAAHDQGVIHRDIKPANILLSRGKPLVADFGIALALSAAGGGRLTETGLSLGSPHYMSPEQATADRDPSLASDIYSLGCVLYEMLVGEPPFTGATAQAVFAKVLTEDLTHPTRHRKTIPPNVDAAICRALEKLPADRFAQAGDFGKALADPAFRHQTSADAGAAVRAPGPWRGVAIGLAITTAVFALAFGWTVLRPEEPPPVERFSLVVPNSWPASAHFDLSRDGSAAVFRAVVEGSAQLFLRRFEDLAPRPVPGTEGATYPAFSPDGSEITFVVGDQLRVAPAEGGVARTLADSAFCCPVWNSDGWIYYTRVQDFAISRVPARGGVREGVTKRDLNGDGGHGMFVLVPGGDVGVFIVDGDPVRIEAQRLSTGERKALTPGTMAFPLPWGAITFATSDGRIMAAPFDAETLELTGPAISVVEGLFVAMPLALYRVSESGRLLYWTASQAPGIFEFVWVSRSGAASPVHPGWTFDPGQDNRGWDLSPDGTRLAMKAQTDLGSDIWVRELPGGPSVRLTFYEGEDRFPRWGSDGERLTFLSDRGGDYDVWEVRADGVGHAELVFDHSVALAEAFWSRDGEWLILRTSGSAGVIGGRDILALRPGLDTVPRPLVATEFDEAGPTLSPDGRWLAYQSDETGRREVFIRPFPGVAEGRKIQVSSGGGRAPVWAHSGEELFYLLDRSGSSTTSGDRVLMSARLRAGPLLAVVERRALFPVPDGYSFANNTTSYLVTEDDQRFLMVRQAGNGEAQVRSELILIQNWFTELEERLGRER